MTSPTVPLWQARLFGPFECLQGDTRRSLPAASDARSLLAYLLLHPARLFPRP
jgi:DNA-binding SARP family transcriptional activator